jgi:hypothetical protein
MPTYRTVITLDHPNLGGTGTNTWHVRTTFGGVGEDIELGGLTDILETFYASGETLWAPGTVIRFNGEWTNVAGDNEVDNDVDPWTVTIEGDPTSMPPANCVVVGWRTSSGGRSGKGRSFLGPLDMNAAQPNGTIADGPLTLARDRANALVASSDSFGNGAFVVYSTQESVARDFTGAAVRDQFAVLRSRRD